MRVSTEELASCLGNSEVVVLDTTWSRSYSGPDSPRARFVEKHIPGARFFDFDAVRDSRSGLSDTVCSAVQFEGHARALGITSEHLVLCAQGSFSSAARAFWMFRYFGHRRVSVLDGGLQQWELEGRTVTHELKGWSPGLFEARVHDDLLRTLGRMMAGETRQLIDARPPQVFSGESDFFAGTSSPACGVAGHIPGAVNLPTVELLEGGLLKSPEALRRLFEQRGLSVGAATTTTCSLGVGASALAFALFLLGNESVAVFDGSWEEWAAQLSSR